MEVSPGSELSTRPAAASIYPAISVASDYRYNGVSFSNGEPVLQGYVHWQRPGYYAGVFGTGLDFNDPSHTSYELDLYAGRKLRSERGELTLEVLYSTFPEQDFAGPSYDFVQLKSQVRTALKRFSLGVQTTWSPEASFARGTAWKVATDLRWQATPWASLGGAVGRRWIEKGSDRTYWDLGVTLTGRHIALDLRYVDTNLAPARCGFNLDACDAAVVAVLTWTLPSVALR